MEQTTTFKSEVIIGHILSEAEKQHVTRRKEKVIQCLQQHNISCDLDDVPNIAVLGSGGGVRAMVGLLGSLRQLEEEKLLDCIMYLSGVSGSTWCMASVYKEQNWSTKLPAVADKICNRLANIQCKVITEEQIHKLVKYSKKDNFSLTDVWAALVVSRMVKEIDENILTNQRDNHSEDPYPIYTVMDEHCSHDDATADLWFEITPHESGYSLTGAFVDTLCFGSKFDHGVLIKQYAEMDMLYLQGLCGSALAEWEVIIKHILKPLQKWIEGIQNQYIQDTNLQLGCQVLIALLMLHVSVLRGQNPTDSLESLKCLLKGKYDNDVKMLTKTLRHLTVGENVSEEEMESSKRMLNGFNQDVCNYLSNMFKETSLDHTEFCGPPETTMTDRVCDILIAIAKSLEKTMCWIWGTTYNYLHNMSVHNVDPRILKSEKREYVDAGLLINSPYFSVLRKEREVDLIISFDFSADYPCKAVNHTENRCKCLKIPFPKVENCPVDEENPKDFYLFKGYNKAPTVIHIPLFNISNCEGEIALWQQRYSNVHTDYDQDMITQLQDKAALNIKKNKNNLLNAIEEVVNEKKKNLTKSKIAASAI